MQYLARQNVVPVPHQPVVFQVELAELKQVVGKRLASREQLFETAQTAVQRMAARIDNLRMRQDKLQEAHVREIIGHLVGKARLAKLPVAPGALHEIVAE